MKGQEEIDLPENEKPLRCESAQHTRTSGPRRTLIAAGHAFVEKSYFAEILGLATLRPRRLVAKQADRRHTGQAYAAR